MFSVCIKLTRKTLLILLLILAAPLPALAGAIVGSTFTIANVVNISEVSPALAFNSTREEYLAVWYNDLPGNDDLWGQRLDKNGVKIGGSFNISWDTGHEKRFPDVAYDSLHDQYLVVWENQQTYKSIRFRRLSGTGALIDHTDQVITGDSNLYTPTRPAVAYGSTSDRFMVVWAETWHPAPLTHTIYAQKVTPGGAPEGGPVPLSSGSNPRINPDIAYNRSANRHMVAWQEPETASTPSAISGIQVHGNGGVFAGSNWWISASGLEYANPAIAALPNAPGDIKFLLVYQYLNTATNHAINGRLIKEDSTIGHMVIFPSSYAFDDTAPAIAGNEASNQYLVIWRRNAGVMDKPIVGVVCSSDGDVAPGVHTITGPAADLPAIAAGAQGDFLLAWQDMPISAVFWNLYGALFGTRAYIPLLDR